MRLSVSNGCRTLSYADAGVPEKHSEILQCVFLRLSRRARETAQQVKASAVQAWEPRVKATKLGTIALEPVTPTL